MRAKWLAGITAAFFIGFGVLAYVVHVQSKAVTTMTDLRASSYPTILVDAGHGGMDGGAVGADGTAEKDINLPVALKLNTLLQTAGFQTVMTRTEDISIHDPGLNTVRAQKVSDIHNRMKLFEETPNCILVSIHQNFFADKRSHGTQVFYSKNNEESEKLADVLQKRILTNLQPENKRVIKPSGTEIYLLYYAKAPAVLVECGFISNPDDLRLLKDEDYQNQMAFSVFSGIVEYVTGMEVL